MLTWLMCIFMNYCCMHGILAKNKATLYGVYMQLALCTNSSIKYLSFFTKFFLMNFQLEKLSWIAYFSSFDTFIPSIFHPNIFILTLSSPNYHPRTFILTLSSPHFHSHILIARTQMLEPKYLNIKTVTRVGKSRASISFKLGWLYGMARLGWVKVAIKLS